MRQALLQVVPFAIALPVMLVVAKKRGMSLRGDVRLVLPSRAQWAVWIPAWIAWVAASEIVWIRLGEHAPHAPAGTPAAVIALKVIGMVLLAPAAEEIAFRGLLFRFFERTPLGGAGAVLATAILFAALHVQYFGFALGQVFVDGLILGAARKTSRSVWLCVAMHALGNAFAAWQRFH